ncbi:serine hydrolase [Nanoarchaeota archaeon]
MLSRREFIKYSFASGVGLYLGLNSIKAEAKTYNLENQVDKYIKKMRKKGKVSSNENTAWSVYDFTTNTKLVSINEDKPLQAASLIKPFVALAFFHNVEFGNFYYGSKSKKNMLCMIRDSKNECTNWLIKQMGGPRKVNNLLKKHYSGIYNDGKIVEDIPKGGKTYKNTASAHDYSRFLFALWKGSIPGSKEIKRLMALENLDRCCDKVPSMPRNIEVYDKTGSTSMLCGEMAIIVPYRGRKKYPYTLVGVIEKDKRAKNYSNWISDRSDIIRGVSGLVYNDMKKRYKFG